MTLRRHFAAIGTLAGAFYFLKQWYLYEGPIDQVLFILLFATSIVLAIWPYLQVIRELSRFRIFVCALLIFFIFPWGEWIRLSTSTSRGEWSLQLYIQAVFLYGSFLILGLFPALVSPIHRAVMRTLESISRKPKLLRIPPIAFFLFTAWIAFFVYRQTPIVQDSAAHIFQAKIFLNGKLFAPAPPAPDFFSIIGDMLVIHDGRWFGMYQPGFAALLALAMTIKAEWFVSPILGAATIAIWISYVRRWHNSIAAALFSWLAVLSPFLFMMSSTIMVFTPELFTASSIIYLCRLQTVEERIWRYGLLFVLLLYGTLVRSFSLIPFLAPVLVYTSWNRFRASSYLCPIVVAGGIITGTLLMMWYQTQTTGSAFLPGYLIEYPDVGYGFGQHFAGRHTPVKSLENISNNLLGMNDWLNGWLSGSIFFVILFFIVEKRIQKWDILLLLGCAGLASFYFFFFFQDLFFGPRYYYCLAPVFLLMVTRSIAPDENAFPKLQPYLTCILVLCVSTFLFYKLPKYLYRYPLESNGGYLKSEILENGHQKRLVFLDKNIQNQFVSWNDPFLREPVVIVRDYDGRNPEAMRFFPDYKPTYYRMQIEYKKKKLNAAFKFYENPSQDPPGYLSSFELAMTMQTANDYWTKDCFDITYTDLFNEDGESTAMVAFLASEEAKIPSIRTYRDHFHQGLIHSARMLLLPKIAFEERGLNWFSVFKAEDFRKEYASAVQSFQQSGDVGNSILRQLDKVNKRIDRNRNGEMSDEELDRYLTQKIRIFFMGG
jgi:hypothetical protein